MEKLEIIYIFFNIIFLSGCGLLDFFGFNYLMSIGKEEIDCKD